MKLDRLPTFEELGIIGEFLAIMYDENRSLDYVRLVDDWTETAQAMGERHPEYAALISMFNPAYVRTKAFIGEARERGHLTLQQVVESLQEGWSFPETVLAGGIMSTRFNLAPQLYHVLEDKYLAQWKKPFMNSGSKELKEASLKRVRTFYHAAKRYMRALNELGRLLERTDSGLLVPRERQII